MRISIVGHGPVAEPLARLAERAGHTVDWGEEGAALSRVGDGADLVILAVSSTAVETILVSILPAISKDVVIVDAIVPAEDDRGGSEMPASSGTAGIAATLSRARIVRAFASVPAEALASVLNGPTSEQSARLAVPFAGDDREAKALVAKFMREIGVEPFDLGALGVAALLDPGGALWQKAWSQIEMLEAVGFLSGDG